MSADFKKLMGGLVAVFVLAILLLIVVPIGASKASEQAGTYVSCTKLQLCTPTPHR